MLSNKLFKAKCAAVRQYREEPNWFTFIQIP